MGPRAAMWLRVGCVAVGLPVLLVGAWLAYEAFHGKHYVPRAATKTEIDSLTVAATEYFHEFAAYPPGGADLNDDGDLDDPGEDFGSGKPPADPRHPTVAELQLRALCVRLPVENGTRVDGPYYSPPHVQMVGGSLADRFGNPYRYLADGRRTTLDPATGKPLASRVDRRQPVIWSIGPDGKQDPGNNNRDDDGDGKVDEDDELENDICSWN